MFLRLHSYSFYKIGIMKNKLLIVSLFVLAPFFGITQETDLPQKKDTTTQTAGNKERGRLLKFNQLDQRKIYHWANGQRSTPAGRRADTDAGKFVRVWGDSAKVVNAPPPGKTEYPGSGK